MRPGATEIVRLTDIHRPVVEPFFAAIAARPEVVGVFHPHPFTAAAAAEVCGFAGADLYAGLVHDGRMLAYGLLRGWDAGYAIPSLGLAVHPDHHGCGLGRVMMLYLHAAARLRGAPAIRLKVYPDNQAAVRLYRSLGYSFEGIEAGQQVGWYRFRTGTEAVV